MVFILLCQDNRLQVNIGKLKGGEEDVELNVYGNPYLHFSNCQPSGVKKRASSRAKHSDFSKPIPLKQHLKLLFHGF